MSDSMVERVARAIAERQFLDADPEADVTGRVDMAWRAFVPHARAAIEAMHEPTPEMADAGWETFPFSPGSETHAMAGGASPTKAWGAMIDAALSEAPQAGA